MTEGEKSDELDALIQDHKKTLAADDPFLAIEARCRSANIPCKWDIAEGFVDGELHLLLIVDMPNGRNVRRRSIYSQEDATSFAASDFESIKILGNYEALYYTDERMIEAALTNLEHQTARYGISAIPGFEFTRRISNFSEQAEDDKNTVDAPERAKRQRIGRGDQWRLCFGSHKDAGWSAEIGSASSRFQRYYTRRRFDTTLRISGGIRAGFHDEALDWLERAANAILFELDLKYGIAANLFAPVRRGARRVRRRAGSSENGITLPRNQYAQKPLSLYWYARSARGMPLLQFLAYYQVLEYHFPRYSRREAIDRIRIEVKDPLFQSDDDAHIGRILSLANQFGKGYGSEREQLKATIKACITEDRLRKEIEEDEAAKDYFSGKQAIAGLARISFADRQQDIRDQISTRIYEIRCRIVHAKDESTERIPELLLPFSKEAQSLDSDIVLLQFLAQRVLIASSKGLMTT